KAPKQPLARSLKQVNLPHKVMQLKLRFKQLTIGSLAHQDLVNFPIFRTSFAMLQIVNNSPTQAYKFKHFAISFIQNENRQNHAAH
ncbi:hypothetical protein J2R62_18215, partial [Plesiomonas shigelloides]